MCIPKTNVKKNPKCLYKTTTPKNKPPLQIIDVKINRKINSNFSVSFKLFSSIPMDPFANNCRHTIKNLQKKKSFPFKKNTHTKNWQKKEKRERRNKTISNWQRLTHAVRRLPTGHNISQGDENSTEGESATGKNPSSTGMGCYKNYDHEQQNDIRQRSTSQVSFFGQINNKLSLCWVHNIYLTFISKEMLRILCICGLQCANNSIPNRFVMDMAHNWFPDLFSLFLMCV